MYAIRSYYGVDRLSPFPGFAEQMTLGGRPPQVGETWHNPNLADTLQRIADEGREAFYQVV